MKLFAKNGVGLDRSIADLWEFFDRLYDEPIFGRFTTPRISRGKYLMEYDGAVKDYFETIFWLMPEAHDNVWFDLSGVNYQDRLSVHILAGRHYNTNRPLTTIKAYWGKPGVVVRDNLRRQTFTVEIDLDIGPFFRRLRATKVEERLYQPLFDRIAEAAPEASALFDRVNGYITTIAAARRSTECPS